MIQAGLGRYGPYLKYQGSFTSLKDGDDLLEIGLNRAVDLLAESAKKRGRPLGEHPSGGEVHLKAGRFGPYVEHNKLRATLPRGTDMAEVDLAQAITLLAEKAAKPTTKKKAARGGGTRKKGAAKKASAKKAAAKKAAS
jgi:DNA topoisomerase-1